MPTLYEHVKEYLARDPRNVGDEVEEYIKRDPADIRERLVEDRWLPQGEDKPEHYTRV